MLLKYILGGDIIPEQTSELYFLSLNKFISDLV